MTHLIEEAITNWFGPRCHDNADGCPTCDAWAEYDDLNPSFGDSLIEGMTEAVTMEKLMRENEELRRERDTAWNDAIEAAVEVCASEVVSTFDGAKSNATMHYIGFTDGRKMCEKHIRALRR